MTRSDGTKETRHEAPRFPSNHLNCLRCRRKIKMFDDVPRVPSLLKSPPCDGSFSLPLLIARVYNWSNPPPKKKKESRCLKSPSPLGAKADSPSSHRSPDSSTASSRSTHSGQRSRLRITFPPATQFSVSLTFKLRL